MNVAPFLTSNAGRRGRNRQDLLAASFPLLAIPLSTTGVLDGVVGASRGGNDRRTCCYGPTHRRFHHRWRRIGGRGARQPPHRERPFSRSAAGGRRQDASVVASTDQLRALHQSPRRELAVRL